MKLILPIIFVFSSSLTFDAFAFGSSNMGYYPAPTCSKPIIKPIQPYSNNSFAISSYNIEVEQYNYKVDRYNECRRKYINNARSDIDNIISEVRNIGAGRGSFSFSLDSNFIGVGYPSAERVCGYSLTETDLNQCYQDYIRKAKNDIEEIKYNASRL